MDNSYVVDFHSNDQGRLILSLTEMEQFVAKKTDEKWFQLIRKLPSGLRAALLSELELGNQIVSIQKSNWPQNGSIMVCLGARFKNDYTKNKFGVNYRLVNDPHYWYDEISQVVDSVTYLVVT